MKSSVYWKDSLKYLKKSLPHLKKGQFTERALLLILIRSIIVTQTLAQTYNQCIIVFCQRPERGKVLLLLSITIMLKSVYLKDLKRCPVFSFIRVNKRTPHLMRCKYPKARRLRLSKTNLRSLPLLL